jgi:hypothetical protein
MPHQLIALFILLVIALPLIILFKISEYKNRLREIELHLTKRIDQLDKKLAEALRDIANLRRANLSDEAAQAEKSLGVKKEAAPAPSPSAEPKPIEIPKPAVAEKPAAPPPIKLSAPIATMRDSAADSVKEKREAPAPIKLTGPGVAINALVVNATQKPVSSIPLPPDRNFPKFDWESLVGVKLFSWIAGVALLLAAVFFLKYSINQGWLMPPVRMAIGILTGIGLLVLCELKAARKYPTTANAMDASAIAILFSTFFAAHSLWSLIGASSAFILMVLATALAVLLSIKRDSVFIALLGLLGGFATPALLSTGENRPIELFSYILLLNAGLAWVGARKNWPVLNALSLVFTVIYQWGWVVKFLTSDQLSTALGIFLVLPILAFIGATLGQKKEPGKGFLSLYGQTANLTATLPVLFAFYAAAVPGYGDRYILLFSFLFLLGAGLSAIAIFRQQEILHLLGGISTLLVWAVWLKNSYESRSWPGALAFIALFFVFYLIAPLLARRCKRSFTGIGEKAQYTAPLLLFVFPALIEMEPGCAEPALLFSVLFLLLLGASAYAIYSEKGPVYFIAAFFALLSEAIWSFKYLTPERLLPGLALFTIFGLVFIGTPVVAGKCRKQLQPASAGPGLLLAALALLFFLAIGPVASVSIWGLALLLIILNAGLFRQAQKNGNPIFAAAGAALSWIVLGVLWANASLSNILIPALVVMAGFALTVLAGNVWLQRNAPGADDGLMGNGIFLGLVGHIFLLVIALHASLSIPPWPFFGALIILDLAIGCAAIYTRRGALFQAAMAASGFLLIVWAAIAGAAPWPEVAILAAAALSLFCILWIQFSKRARMNREPFLNTTAFAAILAQVVAIFASQQAGSPGPGFLVSAHLFFLIILLALAWIYEEHFWAVLTFLPATLAVSIWQSNHPGLWWDQFLFSVPVYLVFLAYPLLLGRRMKRVIDPCVAAVLASAAFFFQARQSFIQAGWEKAIGLLPVVQALFLAFLLMRLLRIEPKEERPLGRLALVAGATLAFITVAIPLQLDKEWITIGWALEGAALAWLYGKIPHKGLLYFSSGLFAAVFVRLALNTAVLDYHTREGLRIWNWYLYAYLVPSIAMFLGGRLFSKTKDNLFSDGPRISKLLPAGGVILIFLLLNIEIADFYSVGPTITFNLSATLAQDLTYTLAWALFAVCLLCAGIAVHSQPARIASIALLAVTIFKCFIFDLSRLEELYRVASFFGLALCLALVALALQKFVLSARKQEK